MSAEAVNVESEPQPMLFRRSPYTEEHLNEGDIVTIEGFFKSGTEELQQYVMRWAS